MCMKGNELFQVTPFQHIKKCGKAMTGYIKMNIKVTHTVTESQREIVVDKCLQVMHTCVLAGCHN